MSCDCHSGHVTAKARHLRVSKVFSRIFHGSQVRRRMPTYNSACESRIKLYREFQVKLRHTSKQASKREGGEKGGKEGRQRKTENFRCLTEACFPCGPLWVAEQT